MKKNSKKASVDGVLKKKRRSFNFIDFLLILFVAFIVFTAINVVSPMSFIDKLKSDSKHTIQYTVEFIGVDEEYIDKIKDNEAVLDAVSKNTLGSVTAVDYNTRYSELKYNEETDSGVLAEHPDKYNVTITITAEGTYRAGEGYSVNERRIAVGEKLSLRFPNYLGEGYCISLSVNS